jgi:hypothetical protein
LATLSLGHKYRDLVLQVDDIHLQKKFIAAKSKEVKTENNLAESLKEGYDSKRALLTMMMIDNQQTYINCN